MPCYHPLTGYRALNGGITWKPEDAYVDQTMTVSCNQCIGCRLERSRQWAVRIMHEAQENSSSCFVTLTYSEENLPPYGSLRVEDWQSFMKRLRKRHEHECLEAGKKKDEIPKIRYFHCGEYGELSKRPHYHAALFGTGFPDRYLWAKRNGHSAYRSALLESCWKLGNAEIGELSFESAAYVARYVTKKVTGSRAEVHYRRVDPSTGAYVQLKPEYATMSRRPGIGSGWIQSYERDVFPSDEVIMRGRAMRPPRFYDLYYKEKDPEGFAKLSRKRMLSRDKENSTEDRLEVREACAEARLSLYSPRTGAE